jgi:hypothetical protein
MTTILLLAAALSPDSTYLRLTLDFATVGSFTYDIVSPGRMINIHSEIRNVDIKECVLSFEVHAEHIAQGSQANLNNFYESTYAIPMDHIDAKSSTIRGMTPRSPARYVPQPWVLRVAMKPDSKAKIMMGQLRGGAMRGTRNFDLILQDFQTAAMVKRWLVDAGNRCKTWETAPMKPIR